MTEASTAAPEEATEPKLLPEVPPEISVEMVPIDELPGDDHWRMAGPPPDATLRRGIAAVGLLQPVVVSRGLKLNGRFRDVYDGRRRIKTCRGLGHREVRAIVVEDAESYEAVRDTISAMLNATSKPNPITELQTIERHLKRGSNEKQIARDTGIKLGRVRARMRLLKLIPALRGALEAGRLATKNAEVAARLSKEAQQRLARVYDENGKLAFADVDEERRRKVEAAVEDLGLDTFDTPGIDDLPAAEPGNRADPVLTRISAEYAEGRDDRPLDSKIREGWAPIPEDLARAMNHLSEKVEHVRGLDRKKRPKWSVDDMEAVERLLEARGGR